MSSEELPIADDRAGGSGSAEPRRRPEVIGIVSPGAMGSALAAAWRSAGARTVATLAGRSTRTAALADGMELVEDLDAVVASADLVVSVVPPAHAVDVAGAVAAAARRVGVRPVFLDANAVAPTTVQRVALALAPAGLSLVDGSISGGPPRPDDTTTLYLSGPTADTVELTGPGLRPVEVSDRVGSASAVKMCTASVYKGFSALLTQALATAQANGVLDVVTADLHEAFPESIDRAGRAIAMSATKAHRFVGEMQEIAATQGAAGMRPELFEAMAAVWAAVAQTPLAEQDPEDVGRPALPATLAGLHRR